MDANAWLVEYQQRTQERLVRAEQIKEQVDAATGAARSADGAVSVTVGPTGALQNLELSPKAAGVPVDKLAQLIMRTAREAHRKVAEQMVQSVRPLIGDSEAMNFLESQVPPAEEPEQQRQHRPSWGEEDPDPGSIMR